MKKNKIRYFIIEPKPHKVGFFLTEMKTPDYPEKLAIPLPDEHVKISGRLPKKGAVVMARDPLTGHTVIKRWPSNFDEASSLVDWKDLLGKIVTVLGWLQRILLSLQGLLPKKGDPLQ